MKKINQRQPYSFVLGAKICRKHLSLESKEREPEEDEEVLVPDEVIEEFDEYVPDVPIVTEEAQATSSHIGDQLTNLLDVSPIQFQVTKSFVHELCPKVHSQT